MSLRLRFKGDTKKEKTQKRKRTRDVSVAQQEGWATVKGVSEIRGPCCLFSNSRILISHPESNKISLFPIDDAETFEPNDISQVFVVHTLPESDKVVLKSAFDRYLGSDRFGQVQCASEAYGQAEEWAIVPQESGFALKSFHGMFLSMDSQQTDSKLCGLRADSTELSTNELFRIKKRLMKQEKTLQNSLDSKKYGELANADDIEVKKAKQEGKLNEALVLQREKKKSDKFCK